MKLSEEFITELQTFQDNFSDFFNVGALIFDEKGNPLTRFSGLTDFCRLIRATEIGDRRCRESKKGMFDIVRDGHPHAFSCAIFSELADAIVPIIYKNELVAVWGIGQKRVRDIPEDKLMSVAEEFGIDKDEFLAAYKIQPVTNQVEFDKAMYFMSKTVTTIMKVREQNDKLSDITSITAHNIKEDLSIVLGFADLIKLRYGNGTDPDLIDYIERMDEHAIKLKNTAMKLISISETE